MCVCDAHLVLHDSLLTPDFASALLATIALSWSIISCWLCIISGHLLWVLDTFRGSRHTQTRQRGTENAMHLHQMGWSSITCQPPPVVFWPSQRNRPIAAKPPALPRSGIVYCRVETARRSSPRHP